MDDVIPMPETAAPIEHRPSAVDHLKHRHLLGLADYDADELDRALRLKSRLIGVNNRNLKDFTVDFARTYELVGRAPAECTFVAESGLTTRAELDAMAEHGIRCFLIGESLMRQADVEAATRAMVG